MGTRSEMSKEFKVEEDILVRDFQLKMTEVIPFDDDGSLQHHLDMSGMGVHVEKFIDCVMWRESGRMDLLLGSRKKSGYRLNDHERILIERGLSYQLSKSFQAFVVEEKSKRCLLLVGLGALVDIGETEVVKSMLKRYGIEVAYSITTEGYGYIFEEGIFLTSIPTKSLDQFDALILDEWTKQVAEIYGMTITEWLRFRLTGEMPENKKPANEAG